MHPLNKHSEQHTGFSLKHGLERRQCQPLEKRGIQRPIEPQAGRDTIPSLEGCVVNYAGNNNDLSRHLLHVAICPRAFRDAKPEFHSQGTCSLLRHPVVEMLIRFYPGSRGSESAATMQNVFGHIFAHRPHLAPTNTYTNSSCKSIHALHGAAQRAGHLPSHAVIDSEKASMQHGHYGVPFVSPHAAPLQPPQMCRFVHVGTNWKASFRLIGVNLHKFCRRYAARNKPYASTAAVLGDISRT